MSIKINIYQYHEEIYSFKITKRIILILAKHSLAGDGIIKDISD